MTSNNLTHGSISKKLIQLAMPIVGTSFVQMTYNLTDMFWVGKIGSIAVAAVGTGGFYTWLASAFIFLSKTGGEVLIAQSYGMGESKELKNYVKTSIQLNILTGLLYGLALVLFSAPLVGFFNFTHQELIQFSKDYIIIVGLGMPLMFLNQLISSLWSGYGNSQVPFRINTIGLVANMILDPIFILYLNKGVSGVAIATVLSQIIVFIIFVLKMKDNKELFSDLHILSGFDTHRAGKIVRLGLPVALQSGLFSFISMILARIVSAWGPEAVAVQRLGSQIESISWMIAMGFQTAISAFTGQNYGSGQWERIRRGYLYGLALVSGIGIFTTSLLVFFGGDIFAAFIAEPVTIAIGSKYLRILGYSQLFMCIEIFTGGAFNGLGKTLPPSIVSIFFNISRIPVALALSAIPLLGLDGVWWSVSLTSIVKGIVITTWFVWMVFIKGRNNGEESFIKNAYFPR